MEKRMEHLTETDKRGDAAAAAYEWVEAAIFALVCVVLVFTFLFRIVGVDGESMQNTLMNHDRLILTRLPYTPERGDIVVINRYTAEPLVKRVIAVGGQTVEIDYDTGTVYVDGQPLEEDYIMEPMVRPESPYLQGTYWEVPEGSVFVMGDNRNNSSDSRDSRLGPVDTRYVLGRAICTVLPFQHIGLVE